ncbi:hypothetical protein PG994_006565 [Apiospora phragmitis]|uniref:DUF7726 domain-containing protein n=1 Tax=Apiospora phragmitis TaxID=2905665 RepID=A0ABR1VJ08_9PEZI
MSSSGWSWDPARPLGDRDVNVLWPSLMPTAQNSANGINNATNGTNGINGHHHSFSAPPPPQPYLENGNENESAVTQSPNGAKPVESPQSPDSDSKPTKASASRKRKSDAVVIEEPSPEDLPEIPDDDPRLEEIDQSCNQIRSKIRRFIDSGVMKVGEFQNAIDVSAASYRRFMNQTGVHQGEGSDAYLNACRFFKKRELQGLKAVPPKKKSRSSIGGKDAGKTDKQKAAEAVDMGDIKLEGEDEGDVPVYETCDELRKKIRAFLKKDGVTQAALCRAISACLPDDQVVQARQLNTFMGKNGPTVGNHSPAFYGGYVFFEKLRIKEDKPKSKFRLEMEDIFGPGRGGRKKSLSHRSDGKPGFETKTDLNAPVWMKDNERLSEDKYGQQHLITVGR